MCKRAQIHWITANGSHFYKPFCHSRTTAQRSKYQEFVFCWPKETEPRLDHEAVFCSLYWWFLSSFVEESFSFYIFSFHIYFFYLVGDNFFFSYYPVVVIFSIENISLLPHQTKMKIISEINAIAANDGDSSVKGKWRKLQRFCVFEMECNKKFSSTIICNHQVVKRF